ncbi:hypothetical protein [Geodermatophilus sp. URMC 60]
MLAEGTDSGHAVFGRRARTVGWPARSRLSRAEGGTRGQDDRYAEQAREAPGWRYRELGCSHLPAVTCPDQLAAVLLEPAAEER